MTLSLRQYDNATSLARIRWYSRYRRHPGFAENEIHAYQTARFKEACRHAVAGRFLVADGALQAYALVVPAEWDSSHFGLSMATVRMGGDPDIDVVRLAPVLEAAIADARAGHSVRHFSVELDCDDYTSINAAIRCGFEILDLKRTYCTNRLYLNPTYEKFGSSIRPYRQEDFADIQHILRTVRFESRFTRDRVLDPGKSQELYTHWFNTLLGQAGTATSIMVGERNGTVVACHALGEVDLSAYGVSRKVRAGSLYACTGAGAGMYGPILYRSTRLALVSHGIVEATVSLNLPVTARVVEGLRPNRAVTSYSLRLAC